MIKRAALVSILSSILFMIVNVYSVGSLYFTNNLSPFLILRMTLIGIIYIICLITNIVVGVNLLKLLKRKNGIK